MSQLEQGSIIVARASPSTDYIGDVIPAADQVRYLCKFLIFFFVMV